MPEKFNEVTQKIGVKKAGQRVLGPGKKLERRHPKNPSSQPRMNMNAFSTGERICVTLSCQFGGWESFQALRTCEDRQGLCQKQVQVQGRASPSAPWLRWCPAENTREDLGHENTRADCKVK